MSSSTPSTRPGEVVCTTSDCAMFGQPTAEFTCPTCGRSTSRVVGPAASPAAINPSSTGRKSTSGMLKFLVAGLVVAFIVISLLIKLTQGPSTKTEVCASFDRLGEKASHANGFFDNAIFRQAADLGTLARRYDGPPDLADDAAALERIGDSKSTNTLALMSATQHIASLCGHRLRV
jgi:hypothetical protein